MLPRRKNKKADVSAKSSADEAARNSESTAGSLKVSATLDSSGTLVIHGTVMAPINRHNDVTVGPSGRVVGKIKAKVIVIEGEVNGDLCAGENLADGFREILREEAAIPPDDDRLPFGAARAKRTRTS